MSVVECGTSATDSICTGDFALEQVINEIIININTIIIYLCVFMDVEVRSSFLTLETAGDRELTLSWL